MRSQVSGAVAAVAAVALITACGPKSGPSGGQASAAAAGGTGSAAAAGSAAATAPAAGVTSPAAGAQQGGQADVCSLMSAAQASSINDVTYGATRTQHLNGIDVCTYANTGTHADPVDIQNLTVQVITVSGCYAELQKAEGPGDRVPGVGRAAFGYQVGIVVDDGTRCVDVSGLTHAELNGDYAHDVAMAKIILTALH